MLGLPSKDSMRCQQDSPQELGAGPAVRPSCGTPLLPGRLGPPLVLAELRQASTDDGKCPEHEEEAWESTGA